MEVPVVLCQFGVTQGEYPDVVGVDPDRALRVLDSGRVGAGVVFALVFEGADLVAQANRLRYTS
jgi:hypothetical protein